MPIRTFIMDHAPAAVAAFIVAFPAALRALLAEIPGVTEAPVWVGSITQISAFGLVAWIVYYMFTKWLPAIQAEHATQLEAQREAHKQTIEAMATSHSTAINRMTAAFEESLKTQRVDLLAIRAICRAAEPKP